MGHVTASPFAVPCALATSCGRFFSRKKRVRLPFPPIQRALLTSAHSCGPTSIPVRQPRRPYWRLHRPCNPACLHQILSPLTQRSYSAHASHTQIGCPYELRTSHTQRVLPVQNARRPHQVRAGHIKLAPAQPYEARAGCTKPAPPIPSASRPCEMCGGRAKQACDNETVSRMFSVYRLYSAHVAV